MTYEKDPGDQVGEDSTEGEVRPATRKVAYSVETVVVEERRQWFVEIIVLFDDEVVRKRISAHRTEKLARISADLIKRSAERDISGPLHG